MKKQLEIQIYSDVDYTNENIKQFMIQNEDYSPKEYSSFLHKIDIYNEHAEKIIRFFARYDDAYFKPERCNAYEPVRDIFDPNNIKEPIRWLSQPGSAFYFKKRKDGILGVIENNELSSVWTNGKLIQPVIKPPYFKSYIKLFINETAFIKKGINYWHNFLDDLSQEINVCYAYVDYWENIQNEKELIHLSRIENFKVYPYQINYFDKEFLKLIDTDIHFFSLFESIESDFGVTFINTNKIR